MSQESEMNLGKNRDMRSLEFCKRRICIPKHATKIQREVVLEDTNWLSKGSET